MVVPGSASGGSGSPVPVIENAVRPAASARGAFSAFSYDAAFPACSAASASISRASTPVASFVGAEPVA